MESSFSPAHYFPQRRRVMQACTNCRMRKTRCDAAKPKCSLCMTQNVECVYSDSQQPRIEQNTRILLERIQLLEDRLLASPAFNTNNNSDQPASTASFQAVANEEPSSLTTAANGHSSATVDSHGQDGALPLESSANGLDLDDVQIPLSHTANANHVYEWPIVQQLLRERPGEPTVPSRVGAGGMSADATDVFFEPSSNSQETSVPPESWRLFQDRSLPVPVESAAAYRDLIYAYFEEVNIFFPLLSLNNILDILEAVAGAEYNTSEAQISVPPAQYCLLLLVLCLASLVSTGRTFIRLPDEETTGYSSPRHAEGNEAGRGQPFLDKLLWNKAKLLLGLISSDPALESAQCTMLASLYKGARGQVADSFHWAHATAVKCEALARRSVMGQKWDDDYSDSFRRLYWVAFIWEGDFVSEISISLPSGIARYKDLVPYPVFDTAPKSLSNTASSNTLRAETRGDAGINHGDELVGFQISTNAAIRRFLNRVNTFVYDTKEQYRITRANYATWLLRITEDLWSHHAAIYRNLPDFLLTSLPPKPREYGSPLEIASPTPGVTRVNEMSNNPWNVVRLKGRYYAGQYIIHRPFIEYVLLNLAHFDTHPCRAAILERSRLCLEGCRGFIKIFDVEPVNSVTCLFATGMVTFTMVAILMVSTVCAPFREVLPADIEEAIFLGTRNLKRFGVSVKEFEWHLDVLERLDISRKTRINSIA